MNKTTSKILSFFLAISLLLVQFGAMTVVAGAADPTVTFASVTADAGEEVEVTVSVANNPGMVSMSLMVAYDSALTLTNVADAGKLGNAYHSNNKAANPYKLSWGDDVATENNMADGTLVTLTFKVADTAAAGDYNITATLVEDDTYDVDFNPVVFDVVSGKVTVEGGAVVPPVVNKYTVIYKVNGEVVDTFENVEEGAAVPASTYVVPEGYDFTGWGEVPATVTEDLTFEGTATIKTFTVIYKVDGEVVDTFENVEYGAAVPASTYTAPEGYTFSGWGEVPATVTEDLTFEGTTEEIIPDPVYYTVTFVVDGVEETIEVEEGTAIGDQMPADPEKEGFEFTGWFDAEGEAVDAETIVNGDMTVTANFEKDPMDVNGDEVVDSKDSIYLLNHCALPDLYPVDEDLDFDFNGDDVVNSKDAVEHLRLLTLPEIYSLR